MEIKVWKVSIIRGFHRRCCYQQRFPLSAIPAAAIAAIRCRCNRAAFQLYLWPGVFKLQHV